MQGRESVGGEGSEDGGWTQGDAIQRIRWLYWLLYVFYLLSGIIHVYYLLERVLLHRARYRILSFLHLTLWGPMGRGGRALRSAFELPELSAAPPQSCGPLLARSLRAARTLASE